METKNGTPKDRQDKVLELIDNALMIRQEWVRQFLDPRRSIEDECGYPRLETDVSLDLYKQLYDREPIATRVVQCLPKECWQISPLVYEDEDADRSTDFEEAWDELGKVLLAGTSWHKEEQGSLIWEHLMRADILSGIGHFGVLLLGIDDGKNLDEPVDGVVVAREGNPPLGSISQQGSSPGAGPNIQGTERQYSPGFGSVSQDSAALSGTDQQYFGVQFGPSEEWEVKPAKKGRKLLFMRAFDESLVQVVRYEWNIRNPRFGMPTMYRITLNDPKEQHSGVGLPLATVYVHWSRLIHLADNLNSSEIFGAPRMRPVLNRLLDLRKLYGGSAEMYWRGAFPGLSLETHPQLGGDVVIDKQNVQDMMENYMNGLQRYLALMGMSAKTLSPQVVDPASHIQAQIESICIQLGIPIRVFKGSERGELASSQDDASWNDRLKARQNLYITPRIIVPFIDRLIMMGILPEPEQYNVRWPDLDSNTDRDKAGIALQKVQAITAYVQGNLEAMMTPIDFLTRVMGMDEDEALEVIDAASEAQADTMTIPPEGELGHPAAGEPAPVFVQGGLPNAQPGTNPEDQKAPGQKVPFGKNPLPPTGQTPPPAKASPFQKKVPPTTPSNQPKEPAGKGSPVPTKSSGVENEEEGGGEDEEDLLDNFDPDQPRDEGGKWSSGGASGGGEAKGEGGDKANPDLKGGGKSALPVRLGKAVLRGIKNKYTSMEKRYGRAGAIAVMTGMAAMAPIPVPGTMLLPIGLAEGVRYAHGKLAGRSKLSPAMNAAWDLDAMVEDGWALLEEIAGAVGEAIPSEVTKERLKAEIEKQLSTKE